MKMYHVVMALEGIAEAREKWADAQAKFHSDVDVVLRRLLIEAALNFMSVEQVAESSGLTAKRIRALMRQTGLNPKNGQRLLAKSAAAAITENSALMGIEPHEMDLMSPLAYLPMGKQMREKFLETQEPVRGIKEREPTFEERIRTAVDDAPIDSLVTKTDAEELIAHLVAALS